MLKPAYRSEKSQLPSRSLSSGTALTIIPVLAMFYVLLVLPFLPNDNGERVENILFWPVAATITLALILQNWSRIDTRFIRSLPIMSLIAYLLFAAASVSWAYSPDYAFSRLVVQVLACIVMVGPY